MDTAQSEGDKVATTGGRKVGIDSWKVDQFYDWLEEASREMEDGKDALFFVEEKEGGAAWASGDWK